MKLKAIKIKQPLAEFYMTKISAQDLLEISFSEQLQYVDEKGTLKGSQRKVNETRLKEIGRYIDSVEMSFPNSIILAANYNEKGEVIEVDKDRWKLVDLGNDIFEIIIPTHEKLAAIIDGQHRLYAFKHASNKERLKVELPCSIFFDLPNSYQAFLFATINGNQKKVDPSLALEQFGFNVNDEDENSWTPEKFAVYISRKLNFSQSKKSVFYGRIKVAPIYNEEDLIHLDKNNWIISTATIVGGILSLISSNPKRDRVEMGQKHIFKGRNRNMLENIKDKSPLRNQFLKQKDDLIFQIIFDYFQSVDRILWSQEQPNSYIFKTVGIQALFEVLKKILSESDVENPIDYESYLKQVAEIDYSDNFFTASGIGKSRIQNAILIKLGFRNLNEIRKETDVNEYKRLLNL